MAVMGHSNMIALVVCMAAVLPALINAALFPAKSPVVQLSQSSFKKEVLDIEKPTLVAFTAPWCGHCKNMAPEFHKAAVNLDGIVKFANIDCDQDTNKGICAQYQVQGFPTVKLFPATKKRLPRDYRGERVAKAFVEFAKDTLPMGARKLSGGELGNWVNEAPHRPKVILFTTKSKSSPLYRSLALDFRKTIDFAFMRGDDGLVRSQGRLILGIDIPTEETLPVLMILPSREENEELEKGHFETYVGALKYHKIKAWLDEVAPKMGAGKKAKPGLKAKKPKSNMDEAVDAARRFVKNDGKVVEEEEVPEGGFVEWKAQKPLSSHSKKSGKSKKASQATVDDDGKDEPIIDESEPHKDSWEGKMLDIEKAGKLADKLRAEAEEEGDKTRKFSKLFNPDVKDDETSEESGSFLDKIKDAASNLADAASEAYDDASQKVFDAARGAQDQVQEATAKTVKSKAEPFARKSEALMKQFEKWMAGEAPQDWEETLGSDFARAQKDAEELLRKDPTEAARQAWKSEEWLLDQMKNDREKMLNVMTPEQRSQVEGMIELIEERMKKKDRINPFERDDDAQFPFSQDRVIDMEPVPDHHDLKEKESKKFHDEL
ncbi:thioredoxin-domain-containing protein [Meira miltonrushii]|uniref:Thioredoxin-domain-containing protein n=1 Tax=Meira miltonrushii TaxID=1280837 RepID=A0A316V4L4_9BASI|nr:thioredoxin-domain-containing protein [Meira miltonrushii]PWN31958.1 thioredoxin-domain-containing protein [Meira miltonrushii]